MTEIEPGSSGIGNNQLCQHQCPFSVNCLKDESKEKDAQFLVCKRRCGLVLKMYYYYYCSCSSTFPDLGLRFGEEGMNRNFSLTRICFKDRTCDPRLIDPCDFSLRFM